MAIETVVSVWGAVTGTAALALTGRRELRDRAALRVSLSVGADREGAYWRVEVANHGRRQMAVVAVGVLIALDFEWRTTDSRGSRFQPRIWSADDMPFVLQENTVEAREFRFREWPNFLLTPDTPIRAFAVDARGTSSYSGPIDAMRRVMDAGFVPATPREEIADFDKPRSLITPKPLAPCWAFWQPKYLRGPKQESFPVVTVRKISSDSAPDPKEGVPTGIITPDDDAAEFVEITPD